MEQLRLQEIQDIINDYIDELKKCYKVFLSEEKTKERADKLKSFFSGGVSL